MIISRDIAYYTLPIGITYIIDLNPREKPLFRPLYKLSIKELVAL
jgi:hypothetical protein